MLHISSHWPSEVHCTRLAVPHRAAYFRLLRLRSTLHKINRSAWHCIFALTGLPECIAEDQQLRIALHISAYWPSAVHCRRSAAPLCAAYFRILAFRSALQKISSSASCCIFLLTGFPKRNAQDQQLRIVLHISAYWFSEGHCRRLAAPHQVAYFHLLAFRSALQKIGSSAPRCIFSRTGLPQCIAQD